MNFYAHLVAASWQEPAPAFALGAMLPDFATMAGFRLASDGGASAAGIAFHHESDKVFHALEEFREHESWALRHLLEAGLRRGPARGIAHVGVELCLDGALVGNASTDALYLEALAHGHHQGPALADERSADRYSGLIERLLDYGVPEGYRQPQTVAQRLVRIMEPRPLLRLNAKEARLLEAAIVPLHERVQASAEATMASLRARLSASSGES